MKFKLALFGLAFMLIASGVVIVLPDQVSAADTRTWDGGGGDVYAGTHANWVGDVAPIAGDSVIFNAGALPCSWNLSITLVTFNMNAGYTGVITQTVDFGMTGDFTIASGTFTGSTTKILTVGGDFEHAGGTITGNTTRLVMTTDASTVHIAYPTAIYDFTADADISTITSTFKVRHNLTVSVGKTLTIGSSLWNDLYYSSSVFQNDGTITGGLLRLFFGGGGTYTPESLGTINSPIQLELYDSSSSTTFALPGATAFGSYLLFQSLDASGIATLSHVSDYDLTVGGAVTIGTRGVINAGASTVSCGGNWDSSLGTFTAGTSTLIMSGSANTLNTVEDAELYSLQISGMITATSSFSVSHDLTVDAGKRLTIGIDLIVDYDCSGGGAYSNLGQIAGPGMIAYSFDTADRGIAFGSLSGIVWINAKATATADRTLTMTSDALFVWELILSSAHETYLMIFDTTVGNVTIGSTFTNGTNGMVYYSYPWSILGRTASPWTYLIQREGDTYSAQNTYTTVIEISEDDYADNVTQYAIDASMTSNEVRFGNGTFVFRTANDFYVGGWNYSVKIEGATDFIMSGSGSTILKFRPDLEVDSGKGVAIILINTSASEYITIDNIQFESETGVSGSFISGIFIYDALTYIKVNDCTFTDMHWGIWGDVWPNHAGVGNEFTNNHFIGSNTLATSGGMALHNGPAGTIVSGNIFDSIAEALFIDTVSDVQVYDNTFTNCGHYASSTGWAIECFDDVYDVTVSQNDFDGESDTYALGVVVANEAGKADCNNITIEQNSFTGCKYGVVVEAGNDTIIQNNAFLSMDFPIDDSGTETFINSNANYSYGGLFVGTVDLEYDSVVFSDGVHLNASTSIPMVNISLGEYQSGYSWAWDTDDGGANISISYTLSSLSTDLGYKIFINDDIVSTTYGPTVSFSFDGEGSFEVVVWYGRQVSGLIVLTVNMVGLGIVISIIGGFIVPLTRDIQAGRVVKSHRVIRDLIKTVVFIVVGLLMWGLLHQIAIG